MVASSMQEFIIQDQEQSQWISFQGKRFRFMSNMLTKQQNGFTMLEMKGGTLETNFWLFVFLLFYPTGDDVAIMPLCAIAQVHNVNLKDAERLFVDGPGLRQRWMTWMTFHVYILGLAEPWGSLSPVSVARLSMSKYSLDMLLICCRNYV